MTREDIEQLNILVPYCFETDLEEKWYNIGLKHGLEIADEYPKSPWISVKDNLPKNEIGPFLIYCVAYTKNDSIVENKHYEIYLANFDKENKLWVNIESHNNYCFDVLYWIPMPKLPKEYEDNTTKEDIRGYCNRNCIYCNNGRCDMWEDFAMPEDADNCDNYSENF